MYIGKVAYSERLVGCLNVNNLPFSSLEHSGLYRIIWNMSHEYMDCLFFASCILGLYRKE
jgi:hypothetical protein